MTRLHELFQEQGQSPWIDNLSRPALRSGALAGLVEQGVRGVTSNPTIFQRAISGTEDYDDQLRSLLEARTVEDSYWELVFDDITAALGVMRPVYDASGGRDGFVSLELAPSLAHDTEGSIEAARRFHERIDQPNLMVKVPATADGVPAVRQMIAEGRDTNVTLIFGLERYGEIIEAYLSGLEAHEGDLSGIASVASFFVSRVDTEIDRRLEGLGESAGEETARSREALGLRGKAAVAQAKLAYELFREKFSGSRWDRLAARGAAVQRPLWASTSTKNPAYPDLLYVDTLIGPDTVNTMPDATIAAFLDHGTVRRTVDEGLEEAHAVLESLASVGIDLADVSRVLEEEGVASFAKSFDELIQTLHDTAAKL